jgi:hypothetical protein
MNRYKLFILCLGAFLAIALPMVRVAHAEYVPAIDFDGWGAMSYNTGDGIHLEIWLNVIDHDGVAPDGSSHRVTVTFPDGHEADIPFYSQIDDVSGSYELWRSMDEAPPSGDYVIRVTDPEGNVATAVDTVSVAPLSPPDIGDFYFEVTGTTVRIDWAPVPGAREYRVRIYDIQGNAVFSGYPGGETTFTVPPGVLSAETNYRYKIDAWDNAGVLDIDNASRSPASASQYIPFFTGEESSAPLILLRNSGVRTWNSPGVGPHLHFWVHVYDAQGVPGDIASVTVTHPDGAEQPLYYDPSESYNSSVSGIYWNSTLASATAGTYTITAVDQDGNRYSVTEELTPDPIGYPAETALSPLPGTRLDDTSATFDWDDVSGAAFYEVEIYDQNRNRIHRLRTAESRYDLPPGFLQHGALYLYRVKTYREHWYQNNDNASNIPDQSLMISIFTPPVTLGTSPPEIDLSDYGAALWPIDHPTDAGIAYGLDFAVKVTDADGAPISIQSVVVAFPDGRTTRNLAFFESDGPDGAIYWRQEFYSSLDEIQVGTYTFTATDFDGNTAQVTDELIPNPIGEATQQVPPQDSTVKTRTPIISWRQVPDARRYRVRVYTALGGELYKSDFLTDTLFIVPDGLLEVGTTYSYRVEAYREHPPEADIDNFSKAPYFSFTRNHFTVVESSGPNGPPSPPVLNRPAEASVHAEGTVLLQAGPFHDPEGDRHAFTHWLLRRTDRPSGATDDALSIDAVTSGDELTQYSATGLDPGLKYAWKAGYADDISQETAWSAESTFKVGRSVSDSRVQIRAGDTAADFQMVSFTQWPDNPAADAVMGTEIGGYDTTRFRIGAWDPGKGSGAYREYGDGLTIEPGRAYWIFARNGLTVTVDGVPVSTVHDIEVPLRYNADAADGWNMIAPPNDRTYNWGDIAVVVYDSEGRISFGPEAIDALAETNPYIDKRLWRWNGEAYSSDTRQLLPHEGYWVRALASDICLRFPSSAIVRHDAPKSFPYATREPLMEWLRWIPLIPKSASASAGDEPPPPIRGFRNAPIDISNDDGASGGGGGCFISITTRRSS